VTPIAAIVHRDYRQRITNIGFVFWDLFVPIAYLTLFGTGLDRTVGTLVIGEAPQLGYMAFLLPGVIAMTAFNIALNTSWGFFMDKDSGIFYELLAYPITRRQLLIGKSCFNVLLSAIGSGLAIIVGVFVMKIDIHWSMLPLTTLAVVAGTAGWFFLMSIFAISLRRMDSFNTLTSAAYILLMFVSTGR
jgi:ABC-2 type transport system permease protein